MLTTREEIILSSIVNQYIENAIPVSSGSIIDDCELDVCSATVRNDVVRLEQQGYIIRPHHAAGSVPSDIAYRYYVEGLEVVELPLAERFLINHLFHQVEQEMDEWLRLTAALISRRLHNVAIISPPRAIACKLHRLELVSIKNTLALAVVILRGALVKQQLVTFDKTMSQEELTTISNKISQDYEGMTRRSIKRKKRELSVEEARAMDCVIKVMEAEDIKEQGDAHLDGLHFLLEQPEFAHGEKSQRLLELVEQKRLGKAISPVEVTENGVQVLIGGENRDEAIRSYSLVASRYGLADEAVGTIAAIGPTRMNYAQAIAAINYLSLVMSRLVSELYGKREVS